MSTGAKSRVSEQELNIAIIRCGNVTAACKELGIGKSTGYRILAESKQERPEEVFEPEAITPKPIAGGTILPPEHRQSRKSGSRFVLTSAQNNTYVHPDFMGSLLTYCEHNRSELMISRFGYNKKGWHQPELDADESAWYDPVILPYVCDESVYLAEDLVFCGELDILPTAGDPLSGFESYTKSASGIIPHAKVAMRSLATMKHEAAKILYTTGAVTQRNYVQKKAGQKAEFHHVFGALAVEIDSDGVWFARQLVADDDGVFHDLDTVYTPTGIRQGTVECVTWGDFHEEKADASIFEGCFGSRGILETLRPAQQHVHDLADMRARNHHNLKDPYFLAKMAVCGIDKVEDDIQRCADKLEAIERDWCTTVVIESNHDQALRKWLCEADGHRDAPNARYWHYWNFRIFEAIEAKADLFVFEHAVRAKASSLLAKTVFLREDDSWVICEDHGGGIECGLHGHRGVNGSRGSPKSYRQIGRKANTGHTHSAGIVDGIYTAGVSGELDMGYNVRPLELVTLAYPDISKRQAGDPHDAWFSMESKASRAGQSNPNISAIFTNTSANGRRAVITSPLRSS